MAEKPVTTAQLDELRALLAKAPALPWYYRPDKYDDWGFIRGGERSTYGLPIVALGREGGVKSDHIQHREDKTDPYAPASELIVAAVNALPGLLDEIERLREGWENCQASLHFYADDVACLHPLQHEARPLVKPRLGGSIIRWAADEIKALRAARNLLAGGE